MQARYRQAARIAVLRCLAPFFLPMDVRRVFLVALLVAVPLTPCAAKKLYKYVDESGVWHLSDVPPDTTEDVTVTQLTVNPSPKVHLRRVGRSSEPAYDLVNTYHGPVEVEVSLLDADNVVSVPALPLRVVIPARGERRVLKLAPADARRDWSYRLQQQVVLGDPGARHDESILYRPPFEAGHAYRIGQAFGGEFSHTHIQSRYAVDIRMPEGTPVCAAREGIVMDVEIDFFGNGLDRERYATRANSVRILHQDGTMAVYAHLKLESALVVPGGRVKQGQRIALSGNTGFSSGPHLHFVVQKNAGMELVSVPFKFGDAQGRPVEPKQGLLLRAP